MVFFQFFPVQLFKLFRLKFTFYIIRYKSPPTQKRCQGFYIGYIKVFPDFLPHRTLHPGKIYPTKKNISQLFAWKIVNEIFLCQTFFFWNFSKSFNIFWRIFVLSFRIVFGLIFQILHKFWILSQKLLQKIKYQKYFWVKQNVWKSLKFR